MKRFLASTAVLSMALFAVGCDDKTAEPVVTPAATPAAGHDAAHGAHDTITPAAGSTADMPPAATEPAPE